MGAVVQFCNTLGLLLESGVHLPEALGIVIDIVDNTILKGVLQEAREKIIRQGKLAQYLQQTGIFPPIAIYLINTGEESNQLAQMLLLVGKNYEKELEEKTDTLAALLPKVMLIVSAAIVGTIVMAIVLPMTQMSTQF